MGRALRRSVRHLCSTAAPCAHTLHNSAREKTEESFDVAGNRHVREPNRVHNDLESSSVVGRSLFDVLDHGV